MRDLSRRHLEVGRKLPKWIPETDKHLVTPLTVSDWPSISGEIGRDRDCGINNEENGSMTSCSFLNYEIGLAWPFPT